MASLYLDQAEQITQIRLLPRKSFHFVIHSTKPYFGNDLGAESSLIV